MNGLDRLTQKIINDAQTQADNIIKEAEMQAQTVINEAKVKADKAYEEEMQSAQKKADAMLQGFESAANSQGRKLLLSAKHELIKKSFEKAKNELEGLSDTEYFEVIYKIAAKYKAQKPAFLMLCNADLKRIPADFEEKLSKLSEGKISLSEKPAEIKNGFILSYGMAHENCSFDSLIGTDSEKLQDKVAQILFA